MSNTPQYVAVDAVQSVWVCEHEECDQYGHGIEVPMTELPHIGTPLCGDCEEEMDMAEHAVIN